MGVTKKFDLRGGHEKLIYWGIAQKREGLNSFQI